VTYAMQVMSEAVLDVPVWQVLMTQEVTGLVMPFPAGVAAQHSPLSQPATHTELPMTVCTAAGQLRGQEGHRRRIMGEGQRARK
jgi:hypothetical protein